MRELRGRRRPASAGTGGRSGTGAGGRGGDGVGWCGGGDPERSGCCRGRDGGSGWQMTSVRRAHRAARGRGLSGQRGGRSEAAERTACPRTVVAGAWWMMVRSLKRVSRGAPKAIDDGDPGTARDYLIPCSKTPHGAWRYRRLHPCIIRPGLALEIPHRYQQLFTRLCIASMLSDTANSGHRAELDDISRVAPRPTAGGVGVGYRPLTHVAHCAAGARAFFDHRGARDT